MNGIYAKKTMLNKYLVINFDAKFEVMLDHYRRIINRQHAVNLLEYKGDWKHNYLRDRSIELSTTYENKTWTVKQDLCR